MPAATRRSIWSLVVALADAEKERKRKLCEEEAPGNGENEHEDENGDENTGWEWLDAAFIAECTGHDEDAITNLTVRNAVGEGSNYCSLVLRVFAIAEEEEEEVLIHLIVKVLPQSNVMLGLVTELGFFRREIAMLTRTLPALQELGAARCGPDSPLAQPLGARALPCSREDTLVMEDLSVKGFRNTERRCQLDLQHSQAALAMLARFHALSVALHREDPGAVEEYGESTFVSSHPDAVKILSGIFDSFANVLETWEEFQDTDYSARMRVLAATAHERLCDIVVPNDGSPYNVLNHGDFWINNFMFRYPGEEDVDPIECRLVDLQMVRFSSLALDLQYFVNTSVREEVREMHLDHLLEHYRREFNESLTQLGLDDDALIDEEGLREEYRSKSLFGLHAALAILRAVVAEPSERFIAEDASTAFLSKRFRQLTPKLLEHFTSVGVI